ncbi:hypothetical protein BOTBODRAFT_145430 [Botryobasidium botryosum FD-172 SS1]|uniref:DUF7918 domain-containing protein n=1 Tax=Botryobasidium botryosum (strain FD-172 SS1) TaxID=930990 RepID=A0A067MH90_BOTB1|nr:hypothetical protein BOTBODRAFT_145430 [Botryobasidium botryosum FD-172 SS1]
MLSLRGFSAWIVSEGDQLEVFKPEEKDGGRTVCCWIPSRVGKKFEVHWMDVYGSGVATAGRVAVDGTTMASVALNGNKEEEKVSAQGVQLSESEYKPFMFSALQVTNSDFAITPISPDLGTITLKIWRITIMARNLPFRAIAARTDAHGPVHEKSKKGGSHVVGFGAAKKTALVKRQCHSVPYSPEDQVTPYVTFIFRYRPLDLLQANDIAPRPEPTAGLAAVPRNAITVKDDDPADDDEKIRALEEQLKVLKSRKRKPEPESPKISKRVKSESKPALPIAVEEEEIEIIDLT